MKRFKLNTKRLIIRPYELKDFKCWQNAFIQMSPPLNRWDLKKKEPHELTKAYFKKVLSGNNRRLKKDLYYDFAVFEKKSGNLIGNVALMDISRGVFQNAYLGYRLFNNYWGNGFAREMILGTLKIAFNQLKLHRIEAGIEKENKFSIKVAKATGLRHEGKKKRALYLNKTWVDLEVYSATCEDYKIKYKGDLKSLGIRLR